MHIHGFNPAQTDAVVTLGTLIVAVGLGVAVHRLVYFILVRRVRQHPNPTLGAVVERTRRPAAYIIPIALAESALPNIVLREHHELWRGALVHAGGIATIAAVAWAAIALIRLWAEVVVGRHRVDIADNLLARQLGTRIGILTQTAVILVVLVATAIALMTFPGIRAVGTMLLASAGVAGLVVGLAARPLFENLIAGIQLALTEPIRIDDVLVVQGYWGHVEEIHAAYVVFKVWDLRRVIVPLAWFINNPFENWTRRTADLMGTVHVFADWTVDVDAIRAELPKILSRTKLWDGRVQVCQVTDATERTLNIRVLVSARNSGDLWDLRCFVREQLAAYLREHQPQSLPQVRVDRLAVR
jgi:small-conductance mechanosensitive channel